MFRKMLLRFLLYTMFLLISIVVNAQFFDDFSDGNFTENPPWTGDQSDFTINATNQLQLNSSGSDTSVLATPCVLLGENEWNIWLRLAFAPSVNNNLRIYLLADVADLKSPVYGYYLLLGENGADDSIDLFRQDGDDHTKIIDGIDGHCSSSNNIIRLKITRNPTGLWKVFADLTGGVVFSQEGEVIDNTYNNSAYFGLFCKYTSSNATKFYFDDLYSGDVQVDTIPPEIAGFTLPSDKEIQLSFSEAISQTSAETITNYLLTGIGNPNQVNFNVATPQEVLLEFDTTFTSGNTYHLYVDSLEDISGNIIADTSISFTWFEVSTNDVVINEIMADPNPVVQLPEVEYIELFNNSGFDILIEDWILEIGGTEKEIPSGSMPSGGYLLLCATGSVAEMQSYGPVIGVPGFQGLTNAGQNCKIKTSEGLVLSEIEYTISWYQDENKDDGGWSLERVDPDNHCGRMENWKASTNQAGGTPGLQNSVYAENIDTFPPEIIHFYITDSVTITLEFSEEIMPESALNQGSYQIAESFNFPESINIIDYNLIEIVFAQSFTNQSESILQVDGVADYCNNPMQDTSLSFVFYRARTWDLVINEIMVDPTPTVGLPDMEYVEILNISSYPVNLNDWSFCTSSKEKKLYSETLQASEFLILCPAGMCTYFGSFIPCMDILGTSDLTNDGNTLTIKNKQGQIVSSLEYSVDWYNDPLKAEGGWSIERIDPYNVCEGASNWSASEDMSGGTPGNHNSVMENNPDFESPDVLRSYAVADNRVRIIFTELLDSLSMIDPGNYSCNYGIGNPVSTDPVEPLYQAVELEFTDTFIYQQVYTLSISLVSDCAQNQNSVVLTTQFALAEKVQPLDIVINEILFNPVADGVDYVEMYNVSEKTIDVADLMIANWDEYNQVPASPKIISELPYLLFPDNYMVLTSSSSKVKEQYWENNAEAFIDPEISLPAMANESGRIILLDKSLTTIDDFEYHEDMQFDLLTSVEGVALERINYNLPTNDHGNWHSASEDIGFGTPGLPNSQYLAIEEIESKLEISPEIFSPDNDGYNDILTISYSFDKAGYVGTITIYDAKGRIIRRIADHILLATSGHFTWDGITTSKQKARIGIYMIYFEYFDLQGNVHREKKTCVLAAKLK